MKINTALLSQKSLTELIELKTLIKFKVSELNEKINQSKIMSDTTEKINTKIKYGNALSIIDNYIDDKIYKIFPEL